MSYEQLKDEQEVSTSAPHEERAPAGMTPGVMVLVGLASIALWAFWITVCILLVGLWTPEPPPFWAPH